MCGIAGLLWLDGNPGNRADLAAVTHALSHRGPDGSGLHHEQGVGLGHRRLSIIDLDTGAQPLCNEDETVWITFNGEIYNYRELSRDLEARGHRFRSRSDTETIVHAYEEWGVECLRHLRGMFAFAIWDGRRRQLFLARDRVGIKPLHYLVQPGLIAFASEMQAFHALDDFRPTLDEQALDLYLHFQYIPAPFSIYREVRKLPPGHFLVVDAAGRLTGPKRYWDVTYRPDRRLGELEWLERLDAGLRETIRAHLVSDVDFGAFLSGGVDSSTVVAYMSGLLDRPVKTFSISFQEASVDEGPYARQVAERFGTDHHEEVVHPDALAVLPQLVKHYGEPFADSSALPTYYVSRLASRHVKMVLSGDGGDELFAGYPTYPGLLAAHPAPVGRLRRWRHRVGHVLRALGLRPPLANPATSWYRAICYFSDEQRQRLWQPDHRHRVAQTNRWYHEEFFRAPAADLCTQAQYFDLHSYLPFDILTKVDVASMCHGLEVRVPLLDHLFIEMVAEIPVELKLHREPGANGASPAGRVTGKYLLKKNGERFFPRAFLHRSKQGFSIPGADWFRGKFHHALQEHLNDGGSVFEEYFDLEYIRELCRQHHAGADHSYRLWSLLFLAEWLRQQRRPARVSSSS